MRRLHPMFSMRSPSHQWLAIRNKISDARKELQSIHPFYDGNGRTGRIINILYLIKNDLLSLPILYLSRYIVQHKALYYHLLQDVRNTKKSSLH